MSPNSSQIPFQGLGGGNILPSVVNLALLKTLVLRLFSKSPLHFIELISVFNLPKLRLGQKPYLTPMSAVRSQKTLGSPGNPAQNDFWAESLF